MFVGTHVLYVLSFFRFMLSLVENYRQYTQSFLLPEPGCKLQVHASGHEGYTTCRTDHYPYPRRVNI